ncbi:MAG: class I SAM-dependent methyltransferase [Pseudomonadota bacterium]
MTAPHGKHVWSQHWADPRKIFDGLTDDYDQFRPHYSEGALQALASYTGNARYVLDLGSGTGILTRALRRQFPDAVIVGGEPGSDMLRTAADTTPAELDLSWFASHAESLPVADGSLDLITVGQAAHWFDRSAFYDECARVLRPDGALAVLYNNRIMDRPVALALEGALKRLAPGYHRGYRDFDCEGELQRHAAARNVRQLVDVWTWRRTVDDFIGYVRSTSHFKVAVRERSESEVMAHLKDALHPQASDDGVLHVDYQSVVTMARFG